MKNTMGDLHNHLMCQIERLNDEDVDGEKLDGEIRRAEAMAKIAKTMVENARVVLGAETLAAEHGMRTTAPPMLDGGGKPSRPNGNGGAP